MMNKQKVNISEVNGIFTVTMNNKTWELDFNPIPTNKINTNNIADNDQAYAEHYCVL